MKRTNAPAAGVTGIIDIGSNTVRLSVYQLTDNGAYRVLDQGRWAARLSQRIDSAGRLPDDAAGELAEVLRHYLRICRKHGANRIRAVATAAIRQAVNGGEIVARLLEETGLAIEVLSGEDEARIGSHAMRNTLHLSDCFIVDIGGGSTEITLLREKRVVAAVSFPVGCVNTSIRFELDEKPVAAATLADIQAEARKLFAKEKWIARHPDLPLIGLGGTVRALAKLRQHQTGYPFTVLHGYEIARGQVETTLGELSALPDGVRRKLPGLSKDRSDVIVPGLAILNAVIEQTAASRLVVCGAGLRDGLFYETCLPHFQAESGGDVLEESIRNLYALYPVSPQVHVNQVRKLALQLFDRLSPRASLGADWRRMLETAARLFHIGAIIDFNDSADHTFYMLLHTHWNGLSHREILLTAAIASYRSMNMLRRKLAPYRSMLTEGDVLAVAKLGSLLLLAKALDRSENQSIDALDIAVRSGRLDLTAHSAYPLPVEQMEVDNISREIKKNWHLQPALAIRLR